MKILTFTLCLFIFWSQKSPCKAPDKVEELINLLENLSSKTDQMLLKMHFESLVTMLEDDTHDVDWTAEDSLQAAEVLKFFQNEGAQWDTLHGSGGGKNDNPRRMLFHPLQPEIKGVTAQGYRGEGFFIYPWGRGDRWYQGQAETDIFECLEHFESIFKTDPARQYLYGFSMGGSGVYEVAQKTSERWTAIGIYSGAFRDGVSTEGAAGLKDLPVWMAWGEEERLAENNRKLRDYLLQQENEVKWVEVKDVGHSYLGEYQEDLMDWFSAHEK